MHPGLRSSVRRPRYPWLPRLECLYRPPSSQRELETLWESHGRRVACASGDSGSSVRSIERLFLDDDSVAEALARLVATSSPGDTALPGPERQPTTAILAGCATPLSDERGVCVLGSGHATPCSALEASSKSPKSSGAGMASAGGLSAPSEIGSIPAARKQQ